MDNLIEAIIKNNAAEVEQFLQQGADPNGHQDQAQVTPLHFAAQHNATAAAAVLIQAGADVHATTLDGLTPLEVAELHQHQDMIALLEKAAETSASI